MPARRKAAVVAALGITALALCAAPASAHGSMAGPVSRVSQCYAEGPESPRSAACKAAVAAGGTQGLYDWNGIRIGDAAGQHRRLIPDGRLCSADNEEFKGLDLARADWPATSVRSGSYTFRYRVTAPHKGTFKVYVTKPGYAPTKPLAWKDLDLGHPVATATDPVASGGFSTFSGRLPQRTGRQLLYAIWQRSDSPEAFYSCSDVTFGGGHDTGGGATAAPTASAPSDDQIEAGADKSTIEHHGHGGDDASTSAKPTTAVPAAPAGEPKAAGSSENLAETGASTGTSYLAVGGAAALALGSAALFLSVRRRAAGGRHGR
ncbi:chitin-binding protein [Streptomyces cellostaticus]|uniref:Chitin-binding protein n=1 Tax=Streptomyces cellostaticus TaxID=67285 RepID=A0A117PTZ2_9ACTN|nr:lytic polysaccharide monooxygenase [Streptomyces cellostaticus]KUM91803.1 chitin-binding protein [Streptomyces cellostaticus]GHI08829.1 chitin-binding protein [Streptomyces cellostaticus]